MHNLCAFVCTCACGAIDCPSCWTCMCAFDCACACGAISSYNRTLKNCYLWSGGCPLTLFHQDLWSRESRLPGILPFEKSRELFAILRKVGRHHSGILQLQRRLMSPHSFTVSPRRNVFDLLSQSLPSA